MSDKEELSPKANEVSEHQSSATDGASNSDNFVTVEASNSGSENSVPDSGAEESQSSAVVQSETSAEGSEISSDVIPSENDPGANAAEEENHATIASPEDIETLLDDNNNKTKILPEKKSDSRKESLSDPDEFATEKNEPQKSLVPKEPSIVVNDKCKSTVSFDLKPALLANKSKASLGSVSSLKSKNSTKSLESLSTIPVKTSATVKLSKLMEMIDRHDDQFWTRTFWSFVFSIAVVRLTTIVYLLYIIYWFVLSHWDNSLQESVIITVAIALLLLISLLNVYGLVEILHAIHIYQEKESVLARNTTIEGRTATTILSSKILMIQEQISKRSEFSIVKRLGALLMRTRAAYMNAERIPERGYIIMYLCGLIANCVVTPSFLMSNNKYVNLVTAEFVDSFFDVYFSLLLPMQFLIRGEIQLIDLSVGQSSNWESLVAGHVTSNVMQIDSMERIFVFLIPFVLYHFGLEQVLMDTAITIAEYRQKRRLAVEIEADSKTMVKNPTMSAEFVSHALSEKFNKIKPMLIASFDGTNVKIRRAAVIGTCIYTVLMATISGFAIFQDACPSECKVPLINMFSFSNSCRCLAWTVNCKKLGLTTMDSVNAHVAEIPQDTTVLRFHQCPIDDVPQALYPRFKDLLTIEFYDTQLTKFSLDLTTNFEKLRAYSIVKSPMVALPDGLLSHPEDMHEVRIVRTSLNWKEVQHNGILSIALERLFLDYNNLTEAPSTIRFNTVNTLSISGNPISDINPVIMNREVRNLLALDMNLTSVDPKLLVVLTLLKEVHFENNNIAEIPESVQLDMLEKWPVIGLTHNPVCESPGALLPELYERACNPQELCSPSCLSNFDVQNSQCDLECNIEACGFDGGDCEFF